MAKDKKFLRVALLLFFILVAAYINHFANTFHFDDFHTIVNNAGIRKLSNIPRFFVDPTLWSSSVNHQSIRPLVSVTLAIDYALGGGLNPFWFHLSTFLWHIGLCAILFFLYKRLLQGRFDSNLIKYMALFGAAWFGIHTAGAETINYIISRSDVLSTFFIVLSLYMYVAYPHRRKSYWYILPAVIGVFAKETVLVLVILLFFYEILFEEQLSIGDIFKKANFKKVLRVVGRLLPILIAILIVQTYTLSKMMDQSVSYGMSNPYGYYWLTQTYVWFLYFKSFFLPLHLSADTDLNVITTIWDRRIFTGIIFIALLLVIVFKTSAHKTTRPVAFGILWFAASLLPTSVAPFAEVMNDHRMYFAFTGLTLAVVTAFATVLITKWNIPKITAGQKILLFVTAFLIIILNAYGVFERNKVWRTEESLWHDVTIKSPNNGRGLMNYGLALMAKGNIAEAINYFERAKQLLPTYSLVYVNLGVAWATLAKHAEADGYFKTAIQLAPNEPTPYSFYSRFLADVGRTEEAILMADKALSFYPNEETALNAKMKALQAQQRWDELATTAQQKLAAYPKDPVALNYASIAKNRVPDDTSKALISITPKTADDYLNLSLAYYNTGKYAECIEASEKVLALNPNSADAYNNICAAYIGLKQWDKAEEACRRALSLNANHRLARGNMDWVIKNRP